MSRRAASWLAWSLAALSLVMFLASIPLLLARSTQEAADGADLRSVVLTWPYLAFSVVGALIASRRPKNPTGWICLAVGFLWALNALSEQYVAYGIAGPGSLPFSVMVYVLTYWAWVLPVGLLSTQLLLLFPDGRLPSRRWRPLAWLSGMVIVLMGVVSVLAPGRLTGLKGIRNPFGLEGASWLLDAQIILLLLLAVCSLASAVSLIVRYRRAGGEVREQIKWIAFAASFVGLAFVGSMLSVLLFAPEFMTSEGSELTPPLWLQLLPYVTVLSFVSVPLAIGFAVLKYRLYDIDVLINRTLVYGPLTATLVALYFGGVILLQRIFVAFSSQESTLAVVASTLAIAALFNPLRRRIQSFVDRRFYRNKYDARKTLEAFSAKLRDETDLEALSDELAGAVRETMRPAHVSIWLRSDAAPRRDAQAP